MPITLLDGILLAVALFSAVLAMVRGFSREVLSVVSWVAAAAAAYKLYPKLVPFVEQYTTSKIVVVVASAGIIFLVVLIVVSVITMKIADFIIDSRIGPLDRTLGFIFGFARGVLLVAVAMLFFDWLAGPNPPNWIAEAKSRPMLDSIGNQLINLLPEDADASIFDRLKDPNPDVPADVPADDKESLLRATDNARPA
jgi:membrane protein required for colicin V production